MQKVNDGKTKWLGYVNDQCEWKMRVSKRDYFSNGKTKPNPWNWVKINANGIHFVAIALKAFERNSPHQFELHQQIFYLTQYNDNALSASSFNDETFSLMAITIAVIAKWNDLPKKIFTTIIVMNSTLWSDERTELFWKYFMAKKCQCAV